MRIISLLKIAAEAEVLRLRVTAERQGRRAALGAIALVFAIGALILAEMTGWQVLRLYVASIAATVILLGANLIIATVLGFFAARASPSRSELEALRGTPAGAGGRARIVGLYGRYPCRDGPPAPWPRPTGPRVVVAAVQSIVCGERQTQRR